MAEIDPNAVNPMANRITQDLGDFASKFSNSLGTFATEAGDAWGSVEAKEFSGKAKEAITELQRDYNARMQEKISALNTNIGNHAQRNHESYSKIEFTPLSFNANTLDQIDEENGNGKHGIKEGVKIQPIYNTFATGAKSAISELNSLPGAVQALDVFGENETSAVVAAIRKAVTKFSEYYNELHNGFEKATGIVDENDNNLIDTNTGNLN